MSRRKEEEFGLVAQQAREIATLTAQRDRLQRFAAGGVIASTAELIDKAVDDWVLRGTNFDDPLGSFSELDNAINNGIEEAARARAGEVFSGLPPDKQLTLAEKVLSPDEIKAAAQTGLIACFEVNPNRALAALDEVERKSFLNQLLNDQEKAAQIAKKFEEPTEKVTTIEDLQAQYERYGYFDTDSLPEGARISLAIKVYSTYPSAHTNTENYKGIVVRGRRRQILL